MSNKTVDQLSTISGVNNSDLIIIYDNDEGTEEKLKSITYSDFKDDLADDEHVHDDRYYTESESDTLLNDKSDTSHDHDDDYYTEDETDILLNDKADTVHYHDDEYYTESELDAGQLDNRYYTESETDTLLDDKSDTYHDHDDTYYTESETDTLLGDKSDTIHNHNNEYYTESELDAGQLDDRYYTESETDTLLGDKSDTSHNHTGIYEPALSKNTAFNKNFGTASGTVSEGNHEHDNRYYTETELNNGQLDNRYYTESEVDTNVIWEVSGDQIQLKSTHAGKSVHTPSHLTISGDLTVSGTTTTVNSEELTVTDKMITVNAGEAGAGLTGGTTAGIEVDRGTSDHYFFVFDETQDNFRVGVSGTLQAVATRDDSPTANSLAKWDNTNFKYTSTGVYVDSGGRVGIGTDSPDQELHVMGQIQSSFLAIYDDGDTTLCGYIGDGSNIAPASGNGSDLALRAVDDLLFCTNDSTTASMIINETGNVGIGAASTDSRLHLYTSGANSANMIYIENADASATGAAHWRINHGDGGGFSIQRVTDTTAFVIDTSSNVGIGTETPIVKADNAGPWLTIESNGPGIALIDGNNADKAVYIANNTGNMRFGVMEDDGVVYSEVMKISETEVIINEPGNDIDFRIESDTLTHALFVRGSDGNVGIGDDAPSYLLSLHTDSLGSIFQTVADGYNNEHHHWAYKTNGHVEWNAFLAAGSEGTPTIVSDDDVLLQIRGYGYDGGAMRLAAGMYFEVDGTPGSSDMPGRIVFKTTADGAASPTEAMRIDSAGNVGIKATPEDWHSSFTAIQVGENGSIFGHTAVGANRDISMIQSIYRTSSGAGWKHINAGDHGTKYTQNYGIHTFSWTDGAGKAADADIDGWVKLLELEPTQAVFNEDGEDIDFRIESDTLTHAFFVEGSSGEVGIGESSPSRMLHMTGNQPVIRFEDNNAAGNPYCEILGTDGQLDLRADHGDVFGSSSIYMRVDSVQMVKIDTTAMIINETGLDMDFRVESDTLTHALFVQGSDGAVGIGITPSAYFQVATNSVDTHCKISAFSTTPAHKGILDFEKSASATTGTYSETIGGEVLGSIRFFGVDGGSTRQCGAEIIVAQQSGATTNYLDADIIFKTATNSADRTEIMRITSDGKVGIKNAAPDTILHIESSNPVIKLEDTGTSYTAIRGYADRTGADQYLFEIAGYWDGTSVASIAFESGPDFTNKDDGIISFWTRNGVATYERMRIDSSGNVGINETTPAFRTISKGIEIADTNVPGLRLDGSGGVNATPYIELEADRASSGQLIGAIAWHNNNAGEAARVAVSRGTTDTDGILKFYTSGSERMRINEDGNVGFNNSSLEAWASGYTALQVGHSASFMAATTGSQGLWVLQNAFYNGSAWKFQESDEASFYGQTAGEHRFWVSNETGTAEDDITWLAAMTIDNAGNVGIGTTIPDRKLTVEQSSNGSIAKFLSYTDATHYQGLYIDVSQTTDIVTLHSSGITGGGFDFQSGAASRMFIKSTGEIGIGTITPGTRLHVHTSSGSASTAKFTNDTTGTSGFTVGLDSNEDASLWLAYDGDMNFGTNNTSAITIDSSQNVDIGTLGDGPHSNVRTHINGNAIQLVLSSVTTDSTSKVARVGCTQYDTDAIPMSMLFSSASSGNNNLYLGGGTSLMNAATNIYFNTAATNTTPNGTIRMKIDNAGAVTIGDTGDGDVTQGLTINQGANDDYILTCKSSDIDHGMTGVMETDSFFGLVKFSDTSGGARLRGLADAGNTAFEIGGFAVSTTTTKSTSASAPVRVETGLANGTGVTSISANGNLFCVRNWGQTKFIIDAEGDIHTATGTLTDSWDTEHDAVACKDLSYNLSGEYDKIMSYNQDKFVEMGIMSDGGFISQKRLTMLQLGAIGEIYKVVDYLCEQLGTTYEEVRTIIRN